MSNQNETQEASVAVTTPLLSATPASDEPSSPTKAAPLTPTQLSPSAKAASPAKTNPRPVSMASNTAPVISSEYKFVHQRIPPREGKLRFFLPVLLLTFQVSVNF